MLLRTKILLVLGPVVAGYALADHLIQRAILRPSFERLERAQSERDLERTLLAIQGEVEQLSRRAASWAQRDGLERFVRGEDPSYAQSWLGEPLFAQENFSLVYVLDRDGTVVWGEARTAGSQTHVRLNSFPRGSFSSGHPLLAHVDAPEATLSQSGVAPEHAPVEIDTEGVVAGLMMTEAGPLLVASHSIHHDTDAARGAGRLILGRFLDSTTIAEIGRRACVPFDVWDLDQAADALDQSLLDEITGAIAPISRQASKDEVVTYATINDVGQRPTLIVGAHSDRSITRNGSAVVRYALLSTLAAGFLMLLVLMRVLQILVLAPITKFTDQAVRVGRTDDTTARLDLDRDDEIGILSDEFDRMLAKLAASRSALVDSARTAGMSEIATGILHNVGNVLNSVGVAGSLVEHKLRKSPVAKLEAVLALLDQHSDDLATFVREDPRGKQLVPALRALHKALEKDRAESLEEVATLNSGLEHIRGLVASQQAFAKRSDVREVLKLEEVVEEAMSISERSGATGQHVRIERQFEALAGFPIDRHKVLEILVNLLRNACQSVDEFRPQAPRIEVRIQALDDSHARVSVSDNGIGIPPENLERIFNHGFTTKANGHGFGLHSAANSAGEMGCSLRAESPGPGLGATFHLDMPRRAQQSSGQAA